MPQIRGFNVPSLSSLALYIQGIAAIAAIWHEPVKAYLTGTKLTGDTSLPALFTKYISSAFALSGIYFKTAYDGNDREVRIAYRGQLAACVVVITIAYWEVLSGRENPKPEPKNEALKVFTWWMLLGGIVTGFIVETEHRWYEREIVRLKEKIRQLKAVKEGLDKEKEAGTDCAERRTS